MRLAAILDRHLDRFPSERLLLGGFASSVSLKSPEVFSPVVLAPNRDESGRFVIDFVFDDVARVDAVGTSPAPAFAGRRKAKIWVRLIAFSNKSLIVRSM